MLGRTNAGGVGGAALNFAVVGGTTQPVSPKANTIWVNTDRAISAYAFSATEPSNPTDGMVWFQIGTASSVAFSATEENAIMVYPNACKQYVGGSWVNKTATSYIGGAWESWSKVIFQIGDTSGFAAKDIRWSANDGDPITAVAPTITYDSGTGMTIAEKNGEGQNASGSALTDSKVDLTGYNKITFELSFSIPRTNDAVRFYISDSNSAYSPVAETIIKNSNIPSSGKVILSLPNNISGEYYIGMNLYSVGYYEHTASVTVTRIACE